MNFDQELKKALQEYETSLVEHYTELHAPERRRVMKGWNRWKIVAASLAAVLLLFIGWQFISTMNLGGAMMEAPQAEMYDYPKNAEDPSMRTTGEMPAEAEEALRDMGDQSAGTPMLNPEEKIIRYFNVSLETKDLLTSIENLEAMVRDLGGYIENSYRSGKIVQGESGSSSYTIRIPKSREQEARLALEDLGEILDFGQDNQNVTQYYRDTESRANFLKAKEDKLMELMDKAESLEDIIVLESKIMDLQFEREALLGNLKDLDNRVDYDTYTIQMRQVKAYTEVGFGRKLKESFILSIEKFTTFIQNLLLFIIESWIFLLLLGVVLFIGVKFLKKRRNKAPVIKREPKDLE